MRAHLRWSIGLLATLASAAVPADAMKAKQNYDRYCAACHGFNGVSVAPNTPNLRFNQGLMQSDMLIIQKLKAGSPKKPPMMGLMSDMELQQVVLYARTIR